LGTPNGVEYVVLVHKMKPQQRDSSERDFSGLLLDWYENQREATRKEVRKGIIHT
jgi:hypothetical protein